ncbi:MAG: WYL domain-containing protein [Clostridium sp.]|jgi:predicted DNA-binding transcriptional regulator YafY|uniref:WYL domain-containing protein n=1 Tax=Clostridium sp. TaxID=1506 RepID=UPI0025B80849|nr:WYL domain-containing protein [Clostridium sp.]MCH3964507.1 WYL domain-containing protein [Clostridium sp.]MCI1714979.1 WYL domain-containing protein [Clostridium sp.]MCI1799241.1 WYL domain-containing protein [Clostridium sp.]MCI1813162.1 WYL domain-containing protein [Clostridium sp.]MCI1870052.1 WYL domain-containing protein [Clostridium sp.]
MKSSLYQLTVNVMDGEGLYYWLLQYGRNIKIISPASVRERFFEKVCEILELYKELYFVNYENLRIS